MFNFNKSFEITDDIDIMKRMGLVNGLDIGNVSFEDLQSSLNLVPDNLKKYVLGSKPTIILIFCCFIAFNTCGN